MNLQLKHEKWSGTIDELDTAIQSTYADMNDINTKTSELLDNFKLRATEHQDWLEQHSFKTVGLQMKTMEQQIKLDVSDFESQESEVNQSSTSPSLKVVNAERTTSKVDGDKENDQEEEQGFISSIKDALIMGFYGRADDQSKPTSRSVSPLKQDKVGRVVLIEKKNSAQKN